MTETALAQQRGIGVYTSGWKIFQANNLFVTKLKLMISPELGFSKINRY